MLDRSVSFAGVLLVGLAAGCGESADKAQLAQAMERIANLEAQVVHVPAVARKPEGDAVVTRIASLEARIGPPDPVVAEAVRRGLVTSQSLATIESRLASLETQVAALPTAGADVARFKRVVVDQLEVIDADGRVRARLNTTEDGGPHLWLFDGAGKQLARIDGDMLGFFSESGERHEFTGTVLRVDGLQVFRNRGKANVTVEDDGTARVSVSAEGRSVEAVAFPAIPPKFAEGCAYLRVENAPARRSWMLEDKLTLRVDDNFRVWLDDNGFQYFVDGKHRLSAGHGQYVDKTTGATTQFPAVFVLFDVNGQTLWAEPR